MSADIMKRITAEPVAPGTLSLTWFEQNHFVLKTSSGRIMHIDPFVSRVIKPEGHIHPKPLAEPDELAADTVFLTHDHRDHTDPYTLIPMLSGNPGMEVYGPAESKEHLTGELPEAGPRIHAVKAGDTASFDDGDVETVYAMPTGGEGDTTHVGYIFSFERMTMYAVGDTRDTPDEYAGKLSFLSGLEPDCMIVPVNDGYRNPGPAGAARLVEMAEPKCIVPCHFGCFTGNTIDPALFVNALPPKFQSRVRILGRGETMVLTPR